MRVRARSGLTSITNAHYGANVTAVTEEIASQPAVWRMAADAAAGARADLPRTGERVVVAGCGTSWFVAQAYARRREDGGFGETDAATPTELEEARPYERVLAITRSGTTTEVIDAIALAHRRGLPTVTITAVPDSPAARIADRAVLLDVADERSVVQTRFATGTLALLRAHLGEDLGPAIADAAAALAGRPPVDPAAYDHFVFLGHGWTIGLAHEAALKMREAAQAHAESYPAMEYRHGPISLASPGSLVWVLGSADPSVADDVAATGATVIVGALDPMAELLRIQRVAVALAESRGLDPDHPRHLTRSVVLQQEGTG
jgi:fructoselysine-6-P-deglycase FrlB-like protein